MPKEKDTPKMKYTEAQVASLLHGIFTGEVDEYNIPEELYSAISDYLLKALYDGFGGTLADFEGKDYELLNELRENIYMFSAAKSFQEISEFTKLLFDDSGERRTKDDFLEHGQATYDTWNDAYARTEYGTCEGQATMARKWNEIERNKDLLPILVFDTKGKGCEECEPFEGFSAKVDDPVWGWLTPLLHFNCECVIRQEEESFGVSSDDDYDKVDGMKEDVPKVFQMNPGKDGYIFSPEHPYFEVASKDEAYAKNNFNLPIPPPPK